MGRAIVLAGLWRATRLPRHISVAAAGGIASGNARWLNTCRPWGKAVSIAETAGESDAPAAPHHYPENIQIGVPMEIFPGEKRVALVPSSVSQLTKKGYRVVIEEGAGVQSKVGISQRKA